MRKATGVSFRADILKQLMRDKNISQEKLANAVGYTRVTVYRALHDGIISYDLLFKISDFLGVSWQYISNGQ